MSSRKSSVFPLPTGKVEADERAIEAAFQAALDEFEAQLHAEKDAEAREAEGRC